MNPRSLNEPAVKRRNSRVTGKAVRGFPPDQALLWRLRLWATAIGTVVCGLAAGAQFAQPQTTSARSVSGQFIVDMQPTSLRTTGASSLATGPDYVKLEPALAAISCERIKRALAEALGDKSQWRDKIYLVLFSARAADDGVTIVAERFRDGWMYRVEMPNPVERTRFVRAIVQTLLQEAAARHPSDHTPEIPAWLAEGFAQHLLKSDQIELIPPPARWSVNGLTITPVVIGANNHGAPRKDPLESARRILREQAPLTVAEISWPADGQTDGSSPEAYSSSAQLFVSELLRFDDGQSCLRAMRDGLGRCYNWQTAFFEAFHAHFKQQLDLEKWWALQVAHFTGRNFADLWSLEESWRKLDELLRTPVEVRHARNELPGRSNISLVTVIREWNFVRQDRVLRAKLRELNMLRLRISPQLVALVDDYRRLLAVYLEKRDQAGLILPGSKLPSPGAKFVVRDMLKELAQLEARREEFRPQATSGSAAQARVEPTASP